MSKMMDPSFKEWEMKIKRVGRSFGNKLRKEEGVQEWKVNKKIFNTGNSSLMSLTTSLISQIKAMMLQETIRKGQM